jgi:glycosyltransferase involved in cell wall biosynthesis
VQYQRHPAPWHQSVERLFEDIRRHLPDDVSCQTVTCPHASQGLLPRAANVVHAARQQSGDVNHILGDVQYLALGLRPERTLLTILDCVGLTRGRWYRREVIRWLWYTLPVRRVGLVSVISESTRQEVLRHTSCDPRKIVVIPACVSPEFIPSPRPFDSERPILLQVGTGANKNIERLAAALEGLPLELRIVGDLSTAHRRALDRHGISHECRARLSRDEVVRAYEGCDLVTFVSTYEGFGLPIVEANAVGRPVLTSNVFSMPEVANGAACLVDPFDVESIRRGITRLIGDGGYRDGLIAKGFENVERFRPARIAGMYADAYQDLSRRADGHRAARCVHTPRGAAARAATTAGASDGSR